MRRALVIVACVVLALTSCDNPASSDMPENMVPGPGPARVDVDTPYLADLKKEVGMPDCRPGPGGGALPAVTLPCLGGGTPVDLSSLRGPMVISFWASWCTRCQDEMPVLQAFHEQHGGAVPVLGIDFTDPYPGSALELAQDTGAMYPSLADPGGDLRETEEFAKVVGLPYLVILGTDGSIALAEYGAVDSVEELVDVVERSLGTKL